MTEQYPQHPEGAGGYPQYPPGQYGPPPYPPYGPYGGYGPAQYGPPPDNHLVWAILTTVFCCLPFGIVSIVKSNQVTTLWAQGLHAQAQQASDEAKKWAIWSAATAGIVIGLYLVFVVVMLLVFGFALTEVTPS